MILKVRTQKCTRVSCIASYLKKTDQIVTLGLFHFIWPANRYTCTLHIHSAITRLGGLVCFSRASFADSVGLCEFTTETMGLAMGPTRGALSGRHGSEIHFSDRKMSLTSFKHVLAYDWYLWDS